MDSKLMLLLLALGMTCGASIQDPYIHDSVEDQIAMESAQSHTVVAAPPHLLAGIAAAPSGPEPTEVEADAVLAEAEAANEVARPEPDTKKTPAPFTVLVNDEPVNVQRAPAVAVAPSQPSRVRPAFGGLAVRQPTLSPLVQMSLLSRLQYGSPLSGYGASPIILLQPIIVPVPMSARDAEQQPSALSEQVISSLMLREAVRPRPLSLMDILQRGYYAF